MSGGDVATKDVSRQCAGNMHMHCLAWDSCGCTTCHHVCGSCHQNCRAIYPLSNDLMVCATCYRSAPAELKPALESRCQGCGTSVAYRNPRDPAGKYLCHSCHQEEGTQASWPETKRAEPRD